MKSIKGGYASLTVSTLAASILFGLAPNPVAAGHCTVTPADEQVCETFNTVLCPSGCWLYSEGVEITPGTTAQVAWLNTDAADRLIAEPPVWERFYTIGPGRTWFQAYRCDSMIADPSTLRGILIQVEAWYLHQEDPCAMDSGCSTNLTVFCQAKSPTDFPLRDPRALFDLDRVPLTPSDFATSKEFTEHLDPQGLGIPQGPEGVDDVPLLFKQSEPEPTPQ